MTLTVRPYTGFDFPLVHNWWSKSNEIAPWTPTLMPLDSTFVCCVDDTPAVCVSVYLTNCKEICYIEGLISNPLLTKQQRTAAVEKLNEHITTFAKQLGYKRMICLAYKEPLKKRYEELGYMKTIEHCSAFCKVLV
jgi:hypothetical protein